ncbi:type I-F CRISPR-associated protein Csy1 [Caballeronia sp. BR00000012568055]|uniref:type I-F CRISPR-associated protein Csy1 n=1 Tax=Caballeronia sp. BR00000012568055 TaxID=2918761 RepID=UPI0023F788DF|nr:type I-F CRISPR-associated protein Csy1 [Caballeronia sp. BR00000012568055]
MKIDGSEENISFRAAIDQFLKDRLQSKLDKLSPDDPKRQELIAEHQRDIWLKSAARRVKQIQAVTHSLKAIHSDARGTNFYVEPSTLPALNVLGSHALGSRFAVDVVGNAAALDVYKLLKLKAGGRNLLEALIASDANALQALSDDPTEAQSLSDALISLTAPRAGVASSHAHAKQMYWLTGDDANDDTQYHLFAPLYPTSLVQPVYDDIQETRFGEPNKAARQARRDGLAHDGECREYRDLAVQKLGGTQPQNVSQLTSERRGVNYLLSSSPPAVWRSQRNYLPVNAESIFDRSFEARPDVRVAIRSLLNLMTSSRPNNKDTRERAKDLRNIIFDELVIYAGELSFQPAGWTREPSFKDLAEEEQLWLDPRRAELPDEAEFASRWQHVDWPAQVARRFGNWLNDQIIRALPTVGSNESRVWVNELLSEDSTWTQQLRRLRDQFDAPNYIPFRKTHDELIARRGHV